MAVGDYGFRVGVLGVRFRVRLEPLKFGLGF